MQNLLEHPERSLESFAGIVRAPQYVQRTPAEQEAFKYTGPMSDETAEQSELHGELRKSGPSAIDQAVADGRITKSTGANLKKEAMGVQGLVDRTKLLPVRQALRVYELGDKDEQGQLRDIVSDKIWKAKSLTLTEKQGLIKQLKGASP